MDFKEEVTSAVPVLGQGGVVVYPTDTVYGLGADATNPIAVERVRQLKGRAADKPILVMVADLSMLEEYAVVTPLARKLAEKFLPGPLTLVLEAKGDKLSAIRSTDGSIGFRIPDQPVSAALTKSFGKPITSTSVNRSGNEQPRKVGEMVSSLDQSAVRVGHVIDSGVLPESEPSTIVDARTDELVIVREGAIPKEELV